MAGRMHRHMMAWLEHADPRTSLIPNTLPGGRPGRGREPGAQRVYEPHNSGADLYPYLILTADLTAPELVNGKLLEMLRAEVRHTTVLDSVPASRLNLDTGELSEASLFSGSEYAKDGLVPVFEYLGRTPWYDRMASLALDLMEHAPVKTRYGALPSEESEVNGNMLQVLTRLASATGEPRYLELARRIGDAYVEEVLPGNHGLPPVKWDFAEHKGDGQCRLRNHGNELISGLSLLYALDPAPRYEPVLRRMFDRILESANPHGMLYNNIDSETLEPAGELGDQLADTWGYVYTAIYSFYQATGDERFRDAVRHVLSNLPKYRDVDWGDRGSVNGYTDTIESALYLLSREPDSAAFDWVDTEIQAMNRAQQPNGLVEHWYGDGNFNRTLQMYILWKSKGVRPEVWERGVGVGAVRRGESLYLAIQANSGWEGRIRFDFEPHRNHLNFQKNYARLNEFPEWYSIRPDRLYTVHRADRSSSTIYLGSELIEGIQLSAGRWIVAPAGDPPYATRSIRSATAREN